VRVVVVDFNEEAARETVQLLEEQDSEGIAVTVDVSQRASCDRSRRGQAAARASSWLARVSAG